MERSVRPKHAAESSVCGGEPSTPWVYLATSLPTLVPPSWLQASRPSSTRRERGRSRRMSRYGSYGLASSYRSSYLDSGTGSTSSYTSPTYSSYSSPTTALPYESKFEALTAGRGSRAGEKSSAAKNPIS